MCGEGKSEILTKNSKKKLFIIKKCVYNVGKSPTFRYFIFISCGIYFYRDRSVNIIL